MADPPPYPQSGDETPAPESRTRMSAWAKVALWAIPTLAIVLIVGLHLAGVFPRQ